MLKVTKTYFVLTIVFILNLYFLTACQQQSEEQVVSENPNRKSKLSIVHDNDLKVSLWLQTATEQFKNNNTDENLDINLISKSISSVVGQIADGSIKADAVVLPHSGFSSLINSKVVNLGSKISACKDMISSSYVAVIPAAYLQKVSEVLNRDVITAQQTASNDKSDNSISIIDVSISEFYKILRNSRFGFINPGRSARGSFAFLLTVASAAPAYFDQTDNSTLRLSWDSALAAASQLKENFEWYAPTDSLILKRLISQNTGIKQDQFIPLGIMSERQLSDDAISNSPLTIIKLSDYKLQEIHSLCISEADWVTNKKRLILSDLQKFLSSEQSLESAEKYGFSPASTQASKIKSIPIQNPEISLAKDLAKFFEKKKAISIAIDTSASMSNNDLIQAKNFAAKLLERNSIETTDLLTFSSDIIYWNEKVKDLSGIKDSLLKVAPSGGSSIYDTIVRQYRGLEKFNKDDFSKYLILITDGGDKNSFRKLQDVVSLVNSQISAGSSQKTGFTSLHIIAINNGSGEIESLKSISEAAVGNFYEVNSSSLPGLLTELEGLLL